MSTKGRPPALEENPRRRLVLADLELPALVLHEPALDHNIAAMARHCRALGVLHAPHAKTTLAPAILERQLAAGAWGMTAATPAQVRALHRLGVDRVLLANVLVDPASIDWIARHFLTPSGPDFWCYVDSEKGVRLLDAASRAAGAARPFAVLIEVGYPGGRTGVRTAEAAERLADLVAGTTSLRLAGVAAYEGLLPADGLVPFLGDVRDVAIRLAERRLFGDAPIVSAGGSSYFDAVLAELGPERFPFPVRVVLRAGCYVTHDHGLYARTSPWGQNRAEPGGPRLRPALELLASVWSRPEPALAIAGFGRRDVPTDAGLPTILGRRRGGVLEPLPGATVTAVNDQHAYVTVPPDLELDPGDVVSVGVSHPCGAFDRWRSIPLLDAAESVVGIVQTDL